MAEERLAALLNGSSLTQQQKDIVMAEADILSDQNLVDAAAVAGLTTEQLRAAGLTWGVASLLKVAFPGLWGILVGNACFTHGRYQAPAMLGMPQTFPNCVAQPCTCICWK
jgi:hypothetical protein